MLGFAGERGLKEFWTRAQRLPDLQGHPAFVDPQYKDWDKLVGYRIHGDAARAQRRLAPRVLKGATV